MFKTVFDLVLWPLFLRGVPGEGPECNFLEHIVGFGPIPARFLKAQYIYYFYFGPKRSYPYVMQ